MICFRSLTFDLKATQDAGNISPDDGYNDRTTFGPFPKAYGPFEARSVLMIYKYLVI